MTDNIHELLDRVFADLDPLDSSVEDEIALSEDPIWMCVSSQSQTSRHKVLLVGSTAAILTLSAAVLPVLMTSSDAPSAAAAMLNRAATTSARHDVLPQLAAGEYYYQDDTVTLACTFSSPRLPAQDQISYVSTGTVQSWIGANGDGRVSITPSPMGADGSHFATPGDESLWVAAGRPYIPCALQDFSNRLSGNLANLNPNAQGQIGKYESSGAGFFGFGFTLGTSSVSSIVAGATNVDALPSNPGELASLLAEGRVNVDGSVARAPQICPVRGVVGGDTGCSPTQEVEVVERLLQLPDASTKLAPVLYHVLSQLPGASLKTDVVDSMGRSGDEVSIPIGGGEVFSVTLSSTSGTLLACAVSQQAVASGESGPSSLPDSITYGPITVVTGLGNVPQG